MNTIIVISVDLPDDSPEAAVDVIKSIDPPSIPHFAGEVRIAVGPYAQSVTDWLDADDSSIRMEG